jgi:hypothetical protein
MLQYIIYDFTVSVRQSVSQSVCLFALNFLLGKSYELRSCYMAQHFCLLPVQIIGYLTFLLLFFEKKNLDLKKKIGYFF